MNEERKSPCKDHPVSVLPLPGEGRARRLKSYQKLNRHDLKVHDLTGRDAALRMNLCPSWIARLSQAQSVRTLGYKVSPIRTSDSAGAQKI